MKKIIILVFSFSLLFVKLYSEDSPPTEQKEITSQEGQAAIESSNTAASIAWISFAVSFIIIVGVIIAIAIHNN